MNLLMEKSIHIRTFFKNTSFSGEKNVEWSQYRRFTSRLLDHFSGEQHNGTHNRNTFAIVLSFFGYFKSCPRKVVQTILGPCDLSHLWSSRQSSVGN